MVDTRADHKQKLQLCQLTTRLPGEGKQGARVAVQKSASFLPRVRHADF
jgi:hypothetical protein